jgi:hypothetical protein
VGFDQNSQIVGVKYTGLVPMGAFDHRICSGGEAIDRSKPPFASGVHGTWGNTLIGAKPVILLLVLE